MRISAGAFKGRKLETFSGRDIRPTGDKIRQAVFNMLRSRDALDGAVVLDVFCGSGALGLEALSQGAELCIFTDKSPGSLGLCRRNIALCGAEDISRVIFQDATRPKQRRDDFPPATLVFLDPPYGENLVSAAVAALLDKDWIATEAWLVCETEKDAEIPFPHDVEKIFGDTKITLLKAPTVDHDEQN